MWITRLRKRRSIENYGSIVEETVKLREVNKVFMDALIFYVDGESYKGDPVPVMKDRGMTARMALLAAKKLTARKT